MFNNLTFAEVAVRYLKWMLLISGTGNGERGTENWERKTGNGELGTGNRERESGNKCTAAALLRIQNGGQNKRKGSKRNNLGKGEFPPAVPPDGQYVLVRAQSD